MRMRAPVLPKQGFRDQSDDFAKDQLQSAVQANQRNAQANPLNGSTWLQGLTVPGASSKKFAHPLGATPRGYLFTKSIGTGSASVTAMDKTTITIANPAASAVTFDLLLF